MPIPTWSVGEVLSAADVNNWFVPLYGAKGNDLTRSSTGVTADPDLAVTVAANATYDVACDLYYGSTSAANFQWGFSAPAGIQASRYNAVYIPSGTATVIQAVDWTATPTAVNIGSGLTGVVRISGTLFVGGAGGTFAVTWAPSSAAAMSLRAESKLLLTRV